MGLISVALQIWLERDVSNFIETNENEEIFIFLADGSKLKFKLKRWLKSVLQRKFIIHKR